jgi:hypothetical protein
VTDLPKALAEASELRVDTETRDESIRNFILQNVVPLVGQMTPQNFNIMYKPNLPIVCGFTAIDWFGDGKKSTQFWRKRILVRMA